MSDIYSKTDLRYIAEDMVEDLRECEDGTVITTATEITITKNENGAFVNVEQFLIGDLDIPKGRQITPARWQKIVNTLYNQLYLHEWNKKYVDPLVLDGTQ